VEPTATPWRVLEDPSEPPGGVGRPAAPEPAAPLIARSTVLILAGAVLLAALAFLLAFGSGAEGTVVLDGGTPLETLSADAEGFGLAVVSAAPDLIVEIVGAVVRPGVYRVPSDSRIGDLVDTAGGYGARVDADRASRELNLAAVLHDGDQIRVPSRDDAPGTTGAPASTSTVPGAGNASGPVDLNRATSAELEALPGIGPVTAGKILTSREEQPFAAVDDLRSRKLVGAKTFDAIKNLVVVR
jgi:competence protein ComEA